MTEQQHSGEGTAAPIERAQAHADFFVLRAPLLSIETLSRVAEGMSALDACEGDDERLERALDADREVLRGRLAELLADDQIAASLELTSPELADGVARWRLDPAAKRARSAERSLSRYVTRLASRSDLFGLAGAYVIGRFADETRLELEPRSRLRVRARVDSSVLRDVVRRAAAAAIGSDDLVVRRNPAVYPVGGRLRVAAREPDSARHRLVAMRATPSIELALATAAGGATVGAIVAALRAAGAPADHAPVLVRRLIASDLLVAVADVTVTGREPTDQALAALTSLPDSEPVAAAVAAATEAVARAPRIGRATTDGVADALRPIGVDIKRRRALQVDARWPGEVQLPEPVLTELRRHVELLATVAPPATSALEMFRGAFERRFASRRVPLLEALDPDFGIRLGGEAGGGSVDAPGEVHADARRRTLLALLERGRSAPSGAVELTDADVAALASKRPAPLPEAFGVLFSLVARDEAAVSARDFQLVEPSVIGPSGARLLGRLCRGDAELEGHVRRHLAREAELDPEAIFAEISVAPETEVGLNITQRPVLREWEIEYGGGSGADPTQRLEPSDLTVSVEDDEVVLRSTTLGRRVIPSSTTAMNPQWLSLPAARFMLSIANQAASGYVAWSWDALAGAPVLPRVTRGRAILALGRWNATAAEFGQVRAGVDAAGFRRLQGWRRERGLARVVAFDHPKSRLLVDFASVLSVDAFLSAITGVQVLAFSEVPALEASPVHGPDGRYAHQFIVPFTRSRADAPRSRRARPRAPVSEARRRFQPGTEWLYANLYGAVAGADRVLVDHIGPLARRLRDAGIADRWFFVRYADPARHLRVRFHGHSEELLARALPALHEATAPAITDGFLYRISIDTYDREVERYGGLEGVELMERIAGADSDAVIEMLGQPPSPVERRHLAVASVAALYADAGLAVADRHSCSVRLRTTWARDGGRFLAEQERSERAQVAEAVAALDRPDAGARIMALRERSRIQAPMLAHLRSLDEEGVLEQPLHAVLCSLAHMAVNRILRRGGEHEELRVHDALARLYASQLAREAGGSAEPAGAAIDRGDNGASA